MDSGIHLSNGTKTTLVAAGATLPNGLGAANSFVNYGPPVLQNGIVYFGATSSTGEGYYSVASNVANGPITTIIDSTSTYSAKTVEAAALPETLETSVYLFQLGNLTPPSVATNLFVPSGGGAVFTANLYNATTQANDMAIMKLSSTGTLSTVIDSASLSGCSNISNFATDGNIYAVWAISSTNHVQCWKTTALLSAAATCCSI